MKNDLLFPYHVKIMLHVERDAELMQFMEDLASRRMLSKILRDYLIDSMKGIQQNIRDTPEAQPEAQSKAGEGSARRIAAQLLGDDG